MTDDVREKRVKKDVGPEKGIQKGKEEGKRARVAPIYEGLSYTYT